MTRLHRFLGCVSLLLPLLSIGVLLTPAATPAEPELVAVTLESVTPLLKLLPCETQDETAIALARMVWGEARGCSPTEQAAVVWCALNRAGHPDYPDDVLSVVTQPRQFHGYRPDNPVTDEILALVVDVLERWGAEQLGQIDAGRVLPAEYLYFSGDGQRNHFRTQWRGGARWDWSLESPYEGV